MKSWKVWLHGLGATIISGAATAVTTIVIDPLKFNIHEGLKNVGTAALIAGLLSAAFYLKQSPLPNDDNNQQTKEN